MSTQNATELTITTTALAKVREVMGQQNLEADERNLRVFVDGGGGCCGGGPSFGLAFDRQQEGDTKLEQDGMVVLIDPTSLPYCQGATIDFVDTPEVSGFKVSAPAMQAMQSSGGGCGSGSCGSGGGGGGGGCGCGPEHEHGAEAGHEHGHAHGSGGGCGSGGCG